ncbi:hypothetical protein [Shewanella sp. 6_MG-2023]|uniref:hypothetical protein n=1 Tax=Shewanella sp. 6_MG-2023 TaxID=3062660 RepID=UPI0026E1C80B|nr:hypothetical protein [Shewanella sp. 6_MG-2023]MDO6617440.1 hypothetical protein [Shewanella sp. 6_MG-2023]
MKQQSAPKDALHILTSYVSKIKTPSKQEAFLSALLAVGYAGLRQVECSNREGVKFPFNGGSIRFYSDCLHSDVSNLRNNKGIALKGVPDPYQSPYGHKASYLRYWLPNFNEAKKAVSLVNRLRKKRGEEPISAENEWLILHVFFGS